MTTFINVYSESITCFVLNQLDAALQLLAKSESLITNDQERHNFYKLLYNIYQKQKNVEACYQLCDTVVMSNLDGSIRNDYLNHQSQYISSLPFVRKMKFSIPTPDPYHISSPSIVGVEDGYECNFRAVNYTYTTDGQYISKDADGIVRTRNYVAHVDKQFNLSTMWEIEEVDDFIVHPCHVMGMEDIRLFGQHYFFCTRLDATACHHPKMCLGTYHNQHLGDLKVLDYNNMQTEKNWLPLFTNDTDCKVIYSFEPLTIFDLNLQTGQMMMVFRAKMATANLNSFRGSAVPIRYKDGWLMTIHQVYYAQKRKYMHRFVWLSNDYTTIKITKLFYFDKVGVEFNLGIAHHDDGLIVTYSVDDNHATLLILPYPQLDTMLQF